MRYYDAMLKYFKEKNMSDYKAGDRVVITENKSGHEFDIGTEVILGEDTGEDWKCFYPDFSDDWFVTESEFKPVESEPWVYGNGHGYKVNEQGYKVGPNTMSDGGPSEYYDFREGWNTWNDFADYKAKEQWKEHSFHLGNVGKVLCRWGDKEGTTREYDARKIVYSGLRVLMMLVGKQEVRKYLQRLLDDPQFK